MRYKMFDLILPLILLDPGFAWAYPASAICSMRIKCPREGTATCTVDTVPPGREDFRRVGKCGKVLGKKFSACVTTSFSANQGSQADVNTSSAFICCSQEGEAMALGDLAQAESLCASQGVVE